MDDGDLETCMDKQTVFCLGRGFINDLCVTT